MLGGRGGVIVLLCSAAVSAPLYAQRPQLWYQAYAAGMRDVARGAWDSAVQNLQVAKQSGPPPARRVAFYGDLVDTFNPDYYIGIAYLNLRRFADADAAFERVRMANLIAASDSQFQAQASRAKFEVALSQAEDYLSKGDLNQAKLAGDRANGLGVDDNRVAALQQRVADASVRIAAANQPSAPPRTEISVPQTSAPGGAGQNVPAAPPLPLPKAPEFVETPPAQPSPVTQAQAASRATANSPSPISAPPRAALRPQASRTAGIEPGIAAYLSGRYGDAAAILAVTATTNSPDAARARFYVACSLAALFLSGDGDEDGLMNAKAALQTVGRIDQFAADRRIISPRVLAALGVQP